MKKKPKAIAIEGVSATGPGIYTADELQASFIMLAKKRWPTIRTDEEAAIRIDEWLRREKGLDSYSIRKLPAFTVLRWLEGDTRVKTKKSRIQPDKAVTKWVRKNWHKYGYNKSETVRRYIEIHDLPEKLFDHLHGQLSYDCRKNPLVKPKKSS